MMRLAKRSVYWTGIREDLEGYFNECGHCNQYMRANKRPKDLPEEESEYPFQKLSMDIAETDDKKEHILVITDRFTGYICVEKTGNRQTGTAEVIIDTLIKKNGAGLFMVEKLKCDNGSNLTAQSIKEVMAKYNIEIDTSSAYHPSENRLIENSVKRVKNTIGDKWVSESQFDLLALNTSEPISEMK